MKKTLPTPMKKLNATLPTITSPSVIPTSNVLNSLTREDLASLAKSANVPIGKSKSNTVTNVANAIKTGKLHMKSLVYIMSPSTTESSYMRRTILCKKFRTYKADKVVARAV